MHAQWCSRVRHNLPMKSILAIALALGSTCLAADEITAGKYTGKWEGGTAGGDFRMTLAPDADGKLAADVVFTMGGDEVKTKVTSLKIDGSKLTVVYTFDLQGTELESTVEGERKGDTLEGKYHTRILPDGGAIDEGAWTASSGAR